MTGDSTIKPDSEDLWKSVESETSSSEGSAFVRKSTDSEGSIARFAEEHLDTDHNTEKIGEKTHKPRRKLKRSNDEVSADLDEGIRKAPEVAVDSVLGHEKPKSGNTLGKVAEVVGHIALSPVTLSAMLGFGVAEAASRAAGSKGPYNKVLQMALLPAQFMDPLDPETTDNQYYKEYVEIPVSDNNDAPTLQALVQMPNNVRPEFAQTLPAVIMFCQNAGQIEGRGWKNLAESYTDRGFNVVRFNYKGVGGSEGSTNALGDLVEDGEAVLSHLTRAGIRLKNGALIKPSMDNVVLYGSSIGGATAIAVGANHPEAKLVANHTFTTWRDAAKGIFKEARLTGRAARVALATFSKTRTELDNVSNLDRRVKSEGHSVTIIETARGDTRGDGVLSAKAKLHAPIALGVEGVLVEQKFDEAIYRKPSNAHNITEPLHKRTKQLRHVAPAANTVVFGKIKLATSTLQLIRNESRADEDTHANRFSDSVDLYLKSEKRDKSELREARIALEQIAPRKKRLADLLIDLQELDSNPSAGLATELKQICILMKAELTQIDEKLAKHLPKGEKDTENTLPDDFVEDFPASLAEMLDSLDDIISWCEDCEE